jgi:transcriptional regulator with XRE-family HTH domain
MSTFSTLLKLYRNQKGLTQTELAKQCFPALSLSYIDKLECELKIAPPDTTILALAKALSLPQEETQNLLETAKTERLSHAFGKSRKLKVESVAQCLASNFSPEELISLTHHLQKLTVARS